MDLTNINIQPTKSKRINTTFTEQEYEELSQVAVNAGYKGNKLATFLKDLALAYVQKEKQIQ